MKVLIDATGAAKGGMQTYVRALFDSWSRMFPNDDLRIVVTDDVNEDIERVMGPVGKVIRVGPGTLLRRIKAQQLTIPRLVRKWKPDVVFCMVPVAPIVLGKIPVVCVAHDFRHLHRPEEFSRFQRIYRRLLYPASMRRADLVIANSEATAREVKVLLRDHGKPVRVVYMGTTFPETSRGCDPAPSSHALAFGHWSNKQPDVSIKAWARLKRMQLDLRVVLHVVGVPEDQQDNLQALARQLGVADLVMIRGFVPDDEYWKLFKSARLILLPSTFEGFGMPVVEALATVSQLSHPEA